MQGQTNRFILRNRVQRLLRSNMTVAERKLWQRLRGKQLYGWKFRRQHPYGDYVLDFVCLDAKLVVEVPENCSCVSGTSAIHGGRMVVSMLSVDKTMKLVTNA